MRTQSKERQNIVRRLCAKSCTVSDKLNNIESYSDKLTLKQDNSFQLLLKNVNRLSLDMGYCVSS